MDGPIYPVEVIFTHIDGVMYMPQNTGSLIPMEIPIKVIIVVMFFSCPMNCGGKLNISSGLLSCLSSVCVCLSVSVFLGSKKFKLGC